MDSASGLMTESAGWRLGLIPESFLRLTGKPLVDGGGDLAAALWHSSSAILAHGSGADPAFFYGNKLALALFETAATDFVGMPSRFSAEPLERGERARLLDAVSRDGYIRDYSGVRISATGRRFSIAQATVWNLVDSEGKVHGQAACFDQWVRLD